MNHQKSLRGGLIFIVVLIVFVGPRAASATVLSSSSGNMKVGEEIHATVEGTAILKIGFQEVKCTEGTIKGTISNAGGPTSTVSATTSAVTFVEPSCNCSPITVTNGTLEIHWISGTSNGTVTASGFTATVTCSTIFGNVTCRYITGNNKDLGTLTGSNTTGVTATMDVKTSLSREEVSSGLCAENAEWIANYMVTAPDVLNVTANAGTILEREGNAKMTSGEEIKASLEGAVLNDVRGWPDVECSKGEVNGTIENAGGAGVAVSGGTSTVTFNECNYCEPIVVSNGRLELHHIAGTSNGTLTASGFTATIPCEAFGFKITCQYITGNNKDLGTLTGSNETGATATVDINTTLIREEPSNSLCAESTEWSAAYQVTTPDVLNVTGS